MELNKVEERMNALIKRNEELQSAFKSNQDRIKEIIDLNQKITNEFIYNSGAIKNSKELLENKGQTTELPKTEKITKDEKKLKPIKNK